LAKGVLDRPLVIDDNEDRHQNLYFLEFKFIPALVENISNGKMPVEVLLDIEWWKTVQDDDFSLDWDNLTVQVKNIDKCIEMYLYHFPEPMDIPEAKYGAVVVNTETNKAVYYTLEYSFGGSWLLCSVDEGSHCNYGEIESNDCSLFVECVTKRCLRTE
jgi:hypothetical protein